MQRRMTVTATFSAMGVVLVAVLLFCLREKFGWPISIGESVMMILAVVAVVVGAYAAYSSWQSALAAQRTQELAEKSLDIARQEWRIAIQPDLQLSRDFLQGDISPERLVLPNFGRGTAAKPQLMFLAADVTEVAQAMWDVRVHPFALSETGFRCDFAQDEPARRLKDRLMSQPWHGGHASFIGLAYQDIDRNCYYALWEHRGSGTWSLPKAPRCVPSYERARRLFRRYCRQRLRTEG